MRYPAAEKDMDNGLEVSPDATELAKLKDAIEKENEILKAIIDNSPAIIVIYNDKSILYANPYTASFTGYTMEEAVKMGPLDFIDADKDTLKLLGEQIQRRGRGEIFQSSMMHRFRKKDGSLSWVKMTTNTIFYNNEWAGLGIFMDITDKVKRESEIIKEKDEMALLSQKDSLTGAYNRRASDFRLSAMINKALSAQTDFSLILFDIDDFKYFNDTYGHQAGDTILMEISRVIEANLRAQDFFARYGGEEFIIIIPEGNTQKALELAERLRKVTEGHDFTIGEKITISLGVTTYKTGDTPQTITYRADQAMYAAKKNGKNRIEIYI